MPQGSVLGPLLWSIMYNEVLILNIPEEANIIGFADNIVVTVSARHIDEVELISNEVVWTIRNRMKNAALEVADQKTDVVLITGRRKKEFMRLVVGKHHLMSKTHLKYLGELIDARLNFKAHIEYIHNKASRENDAKRR